MWCKKIRIVVEPSDVEDWLRHSLGDGAIPSNATIMEVVHDPEEGSIEFVLLDGEEDDPDV